LTVSLVPICQNFMVLIGYCSKSVLGTRLIVRARFGIIILFIEPPEPPVCNFVRHCPQMDRRLSWPRQLTHRDGLPAYGRLPIAFLPLADRLI